jgi:type II secretory pathway pseudopilin PulG
MMFRGRSRRARANEDGFILLESIVAISLITVVLAALGTFTLNTLAETSQLRARQGAAQLATSTMAALGALPPTDLVSGRDHTSVQNQLRVANTPLSVQAYLSLTSQAEDIYALAGDGDNATIPTKGVPQQLNNVNYTVNTYLEDCFILAPSTSCVAAPVGVAELRAVVAVTWKGRGCASKAVDGCSFVTTTLINQADDPVFDLTPANPPIAPTVDPPGNQVSTIGATTVSVQLGVTADTGTPPLTWALTAGTLPTGLTLSSTGLVTGVPTVKIANTPLTVTVTDAFLNTGTASFTWSVVAAPTVTKPNAQQTTQGAAATNVPVVYTCPNAPCAFAITNAPPGLTINATTGVISGTPTTAGVYPSVTVTVTDADSVAVTSTPVFTWTVTAAPTVATPATLRSTIGSVDSVPIAYTCPTANCTLVLTGTAPGIGLSATTPNSTNNVTTTLAVTGPSGTAYLAGTVQTSAVPTGTSTAYAPKVKITDGTGANTTSPAGSWTMFVRPTVGALGTRNVTVGAAKNVAIPYTCANVSCTFTLAGTVPGLGLSTVNGATATNTTTTLVVAGASGTIYINGTVQASAVPTGTTKAYPLTLTIVDSDASSVAAAPAATWTASTAPKITNPGSQAIEPNQSVSLQMVAACSNGPCTWQAAAQVGSDPTWNTIPISSSGLISYPNAPLGTYVIRVIATDTDAISDTILIPLTVATFALPIPTQSTVHPTTGNRIVTLDVSNLISPAADGYTFAMTGQPSWLSLNTATGVLTATVLPGSVTDLAITVTATSVASSASTVSTTFRWNIT